MEKFNIGIETEKKYIIKIPEINHISAQREYSKSEILQIYIPGKPGETHRVRRRAYGDKICYTETKKIRISALSATEMEREITEDEFNSLALLKAPDRKPIEKTRHTFVYNGQLFEIDVYPQWKNTAILETELDTPDKKVTFPEFIRVIREVTGDKRYSNAGMSREFPEEDTI